MARRERRDSPPERERNGDQPDIDLSEGERESLVALKGILVKVAGLLRPLGLSPEESTNLVERMYESVLEMDSKLAGESDQTRRDRILQHVENAAVKREDGNLVIEYPRS